ncbi:MAG: PAS domain S-box protein [Bacteroidetes bacterium]|nr:PAS domain S-box protein [Bacteroidota bacterium]
MFDTAMNKSFDNNVMMASLFENATEGIVLSNSKGEIVLVNPAAEKMFDYTKYEMIGKQIELLIPIEFHKSHQQHQKAYHHQPVNKTMGSGRELFARRKDSTIFPVEVSLSHYTMNGVVYVIAFVIDITIRKDNEEIQKQQQEELIKVSSEVKKLNAELEQKIQGRTMMLRETLTQLEKSKVELERSLEREKELNDLKTRFVSTVSHEFRTPLAAVLSSASLLSKYKKEEDQPNRERHVQRIKEGVQHLNLMLEDLLSLGKIEEGQIEAKYEWFSIELFMKEFIAEMKDLLQLGQQIKFKHTGEEKIFSDKRMLKNVLINMVSNASKFSPENSDIEISGKKSPLKMVLQIKDQGIGISKEDQTHLFERFFRAKNAENIQGTGLGLHIVSKYLELLNGEISLQSEVNSGTIFTITLPSKKVYE